MPRFLVIKAATYRVSTAASSAWPDARSTRLQRIVRTRPKGVVSRRERDDPMTASVRRANAAATQELLTAFFDALSVLRTTSTEVAGLRSNAVAAGLLELGLVPELAIPRLLDQMLKIDRDFRRIRGKLL